MNILVIGQCTLHWGRMEFGNIGNFYIMEPLFRELHSAFPGCQIRTTFQMSDEFCSKEAVEVLPLSYYYAWRPDELARAEQDAISAARKIADSDYLRAIDWADLVINFSGDMWGANANFLGPDRLQVGLLRDKAVLDFGKPLAMIAGSPGPFSGPDNLSFAKEIYEQMRLVTNREPLSTGVLRDLGFNLDRTHSLTCPAFLFEGGSWDELQPETQQVLSPHLEAGPVIGFIVCGWNFVTGPFDRWPREPEEYESFCQAIEVLLDSSDAHVCLMSHSNGFDVPPAPFRLKHGRDYPIARQLFDLMVERGHGDRVFTLDGLYLPREAKTIIGQFDMLVSGRVHAAVAAMTQRVPTVILDYGHEPKAQKLQGFAKVCEMQDYIANAADLDDTKARLLNCWNERTSVSSTLNSVIPHVQSLAHKNFSLLAAQFRT